MATKGIVHFFDASRLISANGGISGATVNFYYTGTTTLAPIYTDILLTTPSANPIAVATGAILPSVYLDPTITYRRRITFTDGSVQDIDPIPAVQTRQALIFLADWCKGDGSNELVAMQALATYVNSLPYGAAIYMGHMQVTISGGTVTFSKSVSFVGEGGASSYFIMASNAQISCVGGVRSNYSYNQFLFEKMAFRVSGVHSSGPLSVAYTIPGSSGTGMGPVFANCSVQCHADGSSFAYGILLHNCSLVNIDHLRIEGDRDSFPITSAVGLKITSDTTPGASVEYSIRGLNCYFLQTGCQIRGTQEGLKFTHCTMVGVRIGIDWQATAGTFHPWFSLTDSHINAERLGVFLLGVVEFVVSNNEFYCQNADGSGTGNQQFVTVDTQYDAGVSMNGRVHNNMFMGDAGYVAQANRYGVVINGRASDTELLVISGNCFQSLGTGIYQSLNTNGVVIDNLTNIYNNCTNNLTNVSATPPSINDSGTYTPTLTNVTNVSASATYPAQWIRNKNIVTVSGKVDITPTSAANVATNLGISLPAASALANDYECCGTAAPATATTGYNPACIQGDAVTDRAQLSFVANVAGATGWFYTFTYQVK